MDWSFTDEQKELRRTVKRFVDEELRPVADQIDKQHRIPDHIIEKMAELGFLGVVFPPEYDGAGMGEMGYCILQEEISRACASYFDRLSHGRLKDNSAMMPWRFEDPAGISM